MSDELSCSSVLWLFIDDLDIRNLMRLFDISCIHVIISINEMSSFFILCKRTGHFYKYILAVCIDEKEAGENGVPLSLRMYSGAKGLHRPVMSGSQDLGTPVSKNSPASEGRYKVAAPWLASGEIKYIDDLPEAKGQLFVFPVMSTVARAKIVNVDTTEACGIPGVVCVLQVIITLEYFFPTS